MFLQWFIVEALIYPITNGQMPDNQNLELNDDMVKIRGGTQDLILPWAKF